MNFSKCCAVSVVILIVICRFNHAIIIFNFIFLRGRNQKIKIKMKGIEYFSYCLLAAAFPFKYLLSVKFLMIS